MQTPGESSRKHSPDVTPGNTSRKHGQDANHRKVFEKARSGCKPRENLPENTARMQTPGKSSRKHGQDANLRRVFERTRSRCKPKERLRENTVRMQTDDLPPNRFTFFSNISWHSTRVFTCILGHGSSTLAPPPLNPTRVFSAISSGDQFWGSRGDPPLHVCVLGILLHSTRVFTRGLPISQPGVQRRGEGAR